MSVGTQSRLGQRNGGLRLREMLAGALRAGLRGAGLMVASLRRSTVHVFLRRFELALRGARQLSHLPARERLDLFARALQRIARLVHRGGGRVLHRR